MTAMLTTMPGSNVLISAEAAAALRDLGRAVSRARRARGDTQAVAGERIGVHLATIQRIERGDPKVAVGTVFALLAAYGLSRKLFDLAEDDETTRLLAQRSLPQRVRSRGKRGGPP